MPSKEEPDAGHQILRDRAQGFVKDSDEPSVQPRLRTTNLEPHVWTQQRMEPSAQRNHKDSKLRGPGRKEGGVRMRLKQGTNLLGGLGMK